MADILSSPGIRAAGRSDVYRESKFFALLLQNGSKVCVLTLERKEDV